MVGMMIAPFFFAMLSYVRIISLIQGVSSELVKDVIR